MNAIRFFAAVALGFGLIGNAGAIEDSTCEVPSVDGSGAVLDRCSGVAEATAYEVRTFNISPVEVDFGAVKVGVRVVVPVTFTNFTNQPLPLAGGGFSTGAFAATNGTCGGSVPANDSCSFMYYFQPTVAAQTFTAQTSVSVNADYQTLKFRGTGTESLAQVTPVTIDFGDALLGQMLKVPVTLRNTHDAALNLSGGGFSGPSAFGNASGSTCGGAPIAAGASCFLNYSFTPSAVGPATGSTGVGLASGSGLYLHTGLAFKGNGIATAPQVSVYPRSVDFGSVKIGRTTSVPVTIANHTSVTLTPSGGGFNDSAGGAFAATTGCGGSIAPGQSCAFTYYFQPRLTEATVNASTSIGLVGSGVPYQNFPLSFSGTGTGTLALVTPTTIDFGRVRTGTSMSVPVTITNTSEAPLTGFLGGAVPPQFAATNACPTSLAVGANCTITYTFYANAMKLGAQSADTVISFTNTTGVRPSVAIHLDAFSDDPDKIFFNGFD